MSFHTFIGVCGRAPGADTSAVAAINRALQKGLVQVVDDVLDIFYADG